MASSLKKSGGGPFFLFPALAFLTAALFCLCMTLGRFRIPLGTLFRVLLAPLFSWEQNWSQNVENVIWAIRLPRLCGAMLIGSALALSGTAYQSMFRNPLVSSDILGVSAGACVGASLAIIADASLKAVQLGALAGGLLAVLLTNWLARAFRSRSSLILVLSGVIIGGFFKSLQALLLYAADPETQLGTITYWTMGSLAKVGAGDLAALGWPMICCGAVLLAIRWRLNLLSLGEAEAFALGADTRLLRNLTVFCATALTACAICMAGTVGWISLVVPHFGRLIAGADNRRLLPVSALLGASFMMAVDTLARNLTRSEIPLSVLTGFIGAPFYVWLLLRQHFGLEGDRT